jgi:putative transposase
MNFVSDFTAEGQRLKILTIIDDFTRYCPAIEVETSIPGARVAQVLERLATEDHLREVIESDNGPEFTAKMLDSWGLQAQGALRLHSARQAGGERFHREL